MRSTDMKNELLGDVMNIYGGLHYFVKEETPEVLEGITAVDSLIDKVLIDLTENTEFQVEECVASQILNLSFTKLTELGLDFDEPSKGMMEIIKRNILKFTRDNNISSELLLKINDVFNIHLWKGYTAETEYFTVLGEIMSRVTVKNEPIIPSIESINEVVTEEEINAEVINVYDCKNIKDINFCNEMIGDYPFNLQDLDALKEKLIVGLTTQYNDEVKGYITINTITNTVLDIESFIKDTILVLSDIICNYEKVDLEIKKDYRHYYEIMSEIVEMMNDDNILINFEDSVLEKKINSVKYLIGNF